MKKRKMCIDKGKRVIQYWMAPEAGESLFLCVWFLFLTREALVTTMFPLPGIFYNVVSLMTVGGIALKILCYDSYRLSELAAVLFLGAAALAVVRCSGYQEPLFWTVLMIGARGVSFRKILKVYLVVSVAVVGLAFVASLLGVIVNLRYQAGSRGVRNSFGIIYPTDFAAHIFFLMLVFYYLLNERMKVWQYVGSLIIAVFVYIFCDTRLDVICMILMIVIYMSICRKNQFCRRMKRKYRSLSWITKYMAYSMPFAALFMSNMTLLYNSGNVFWKKINEILTNRLSLGQFALREYGLKLFGQQVYMNGNGGSTVLLKDYFFVDCSYLYILLRYGLVFLTIVLITYVLCCKKYKDDEHFLLMIALVSLNCMIAHHLIELAYCPFALALFAKRDPMKAEARHG